MLTIATVTLTILVTFKQLPTTPQMFNIPGGDVNESIYAFLVATRTRDWLWLAENHIRTRAVHGVFTPCDALRQMVEDTISIDLVNTDTKMPICPRPSLLPSLVPKARAHRIDRVPIIDPPARTRCDCLEISGIPIPVCEDDRAKLIFAHQCTDTVTTAK